MIKKRFISMLVLLMTAVTGAWADDTYTVQFKANGNTKTVENVVLPYTFWCDLNNENGELDQIIKELYGWSAGFCSGGMNSSGNENVTCGKNDQEDDYITISAPFEGTATVTGWYYDDSDYVEYSLEISIPGYVAPVNVTGVSLSETSAEMTLGGDALTLTATVAPDDATDKTVTWTTSDASVATVADGVVTAVGAGTATITATATNGTADTSDDKTATCEVTVSPAGYSVALKEGTEDATSWQGKAGTGDYQELPLTGLEAGTAVSVKYSGAKKVKSVKARKKTASAPAAKAAAEATADDLGKVIGADGNIYDDADAATAASTTAVAMIAYVGSGTDHATYTNGLALALADDYGKQGWTDITSHSPAVTGGTWVLASETQWTQMITSMGSDGLRDGFSSIGGTNLENYYYWSSTPGETGYRRYDFSDKDWYNSNPITGKGYGRACLVF